MVSTLTHRLFRSVLFNFQKRRDFQISFSIIWIFSLVPLCLEKHNFDSSKFAKVCFMVQIIVGHILCVLEKNGHLLVSQFGKVS